MQTQEPLPANAIQWLRTRFGVLNRTGGDAEQTSFDVFRRTDLVWGWNEWGSDTAWKFPSRPKQRAGFRG